MSYFIKEHIAPARYELCTFCLTHLICFMKDIKLKSSKILLHRWPGMEKREKRNHFPKSKKTSTKYDGFLELCDFETWKIKLEFLLGTLGLFIFLISLLIVLKRLCILVLDSFKFLKLTLQIAGYNPRSLPALWTC